MPAYGYAQRVHGTEEHDLGISPIGGVLVVLVGLIGAAMFLNPDMPSFDMRLGSIIILSIALSFGPGKIQRWRNEGDITRTFLYALVGAAAVGILGAILDFAFFSSTAVGPMSMTLLLVLATPAIFEELLFRAGVFLTLQRVVGTWPAVIIQAFLFAVFHAYVGLDANYFLLLFIGGIILQLVFIASKNILSSMVAHAIINLRPFLFDLLLTPAVLIIVAIGVVLYFIVGRRLR